jgi:hypothetical protein
VLVRLLLSKWPSWGPGLLLTASILTYWAQKGWVGAAGDIVPTSSNEGMSKMTEAV